ncbi:MAG: thioredoxin domain-containing protein [Acidobacteria bacterium]|nr:thioredoxin domain-containing protein [Acidobacteriota bacterium]
MLKRAGFGGVIVARVMIAGVVAFGAAACQQKSDEIAALRKDVDAIRSEQAALRKSVDGIAALLKPAQPAAIADAPAGMTIPVTGLPSRGSESAAVVLVEFSDYECQFCGRFARDAYPAIDLEYVQTGKVRHVFRSFPLESIHKNAFKAHEAALCAGEQGKYWPMHDRLFAHQRALAPADLSAYAIAIGLDAAAFEQCQASGRMAGQVRRDVEVGNRLGVQGTPLFLIGTPGATGEVRVLKAIDGAQPYSVFKQAISEVMAAPRQE